MKPQTIHSYPGQPYSDEIPIPKHYKPAAPMSKYSKSALVSQFRQELNPNNPHNPQYAGQAVQAANCQCSGSGHQ